MSETKLKGQALGHVKRKDVSTITVIGNLAIVCGWDWIQGNGTNKRYAKTITYGVDFATVPIVTAIINGAKVGSDPTTQADWDTGITSETDYYNAAISNPRTNGFSIEIMKPTAAVGSTVRVGFTWVAIGQLA